MLAALVALSLAAGEPAVHGKPQPRGSCLSPELPRRYAYQLRFNRVRAQSVLGMVEHLTGWRWTVPADAKLLLTTNLNGGHVNAVQLSQGVDGALRFAGYTLTESKGVCAYARTDASKPQIVEASFANGAWTYAAGK